MTKIYRLFPWFWLFCFLVPLLHYRMSWVSVLVEDLDHCPLWMCDFQKHYLPQAELLYRGQSNLQPGWFYPPLLAILLMPVAMTEYALQVWTLLNLGAVLGMAFCVSKETKLGIGFSIALLMSSLPVLHALKWGQVSLFLFCCIFYAYQKKWLLGVALAFAGAIKLYPWVLFIDIAYHKNKRHIVSFIVGSSVLLLLPFLFMEWDLHLLFWERVSSGARQVRSFASTGGGQALWPVLIRFFHDGSHVGLVGYEPILLRLPLLVLQMMWATFMGVIVLVSKRTYVLLPQRSLKLVLLLCALSLLLSPGWHHYFAFLPFGIALVWRTAQHPISRIIVMVAFSLQAIPILFLGVWTNLYAYYSLVGGTFWSTLLLWYALVRIGKRISFRDESKRIRAAQIPS